MRCLIAENQRREIIEAIPPGGTMLEWGAGGSTIWMLDRLQPGQSLVTIEHDAAWHQMIVGAAGERSNWTPVFREPWGAYPIGENATRWEECPVGMDDYINQPQIASADVFLIDGVARGACLAAAMLAGKPGASVFLHDAERDWYGWAKRLGRAVDARIIEPDDGEYPPKMWACRLH